MWDQAVNRFTAEFIEDFCDSKGAIDWEKLVEFASSTKATRRTRKEDASHDAANS